MKRSIIISTGIGLAALVAGLGLSGCKKETGSHSGQLLEVTASIEGVDNGGSDNKASRAIISDAAWKDNSTFGLWVVPYKVTGTPGTAGTLRTVGNYADNILHTYSLANQKFTPSATIYYPSAKGKVDLYAISPQKTYTDNTLASTTAYPHSVLADQSATNGSGIIASDLMTGKGEGSVSNGASIEFHHRMSKALIKITVPQTYKGTNVNSVKSVEVCNVPLNTTVDLTDPNATVPTPTGNQSNISAYQAEKTIETSTTDYTYEAIVVPGAKIEAGGAIVRITLEMSNNTDVIFNVTLSQAHTFEAKKQTSINVTIEGQTEINLDNSKVTIEGWGKGIQINDGTTKFSKMLFEYEDSNNSWPAAKGCDAATLVIEGDTFEATKVTYDDAKKLYLIEYNHDQNFGGYLQRLTLKKADNTLTVFNDKDLTSAGANPGYLIKGNPTLDDYNLRIGKITIQSGNSANITPIP